MKLNGFSILMIDSIKKQFKLFKLNPTQMINKDIQQ